MTIVVTGGGTGGHIYPAIAVAEELRSRDADITVSYIGAIEGREAGVAEEHGFPFFGVPARKIRRLASPSTLPALIALYRGYRRARAYLHATSPRAVLGTGGYVAAAATIAAAGLNIPVVIHEQNAVAGRTNRWLARRSTRVCVTYVESAREFPAEKVVVTGLPLRAALATTVRREEARKAMSLNEDAFVVLVLGGSQGAAALNRVVSATLPSLGSDFAVIHQTGENYESPSHASACRYMPMRYLDTHTLSLAYGAADLCLCRCGASTLAEIAVAGLPALLVPYPLAYADHQTANARAVASAGAGVLIPQTELTEHRLVEELQNLRSNREKLRQMGQASAALARPNAARDVAEQVLACAHLPVREAR
jgi:UDP-N-acetylglucosamine--N-acetylmuramyl-(pentapeptide) pyrophosphoryl-undecaprenol N-acetylglucosamine transferase